MAKRIWIQALAVVHVVMLLGPGSGERFFQYRDHRDQDKYLKIQNQNIVHNTFEAEVQLEKYGYLKCKVRRKKRSLAPWEQILEGISSGKEILIDIPFCNDDHVRDAIKHYQKTYKLPETGLLDEETRNLMSTSRCGNKDNAAEVASLDTTTDDSVAETISDSQPQPHGRTKRMKRSARSTRIMKVLVGKVPSSLERRKRYVSDYLDAIADDSPPVPHPVEDRRKRNILVTDNTDGGIAAHVNGHANWHGQKFNKKVVYWRLLTSGYSTRIPVEDQRVTIGLAFRMWSEVIPLRFVEDSASDIQTVDIEIAFGRGNHQNCIRKFDGHGGEIAHSWQTGSMHFDDEENFKSVKSFSPEGIYLLRIAVHEIGHVLGLSHTDKPQSIMYAIYQSQNLQPDFELGWDDRKEIQSIYGGCRGRFDTIFDWVRKRPDNQFIFNSYFFRGAHYWMYENHANRTRYGDPLYIATEWEGVPNFIDAYAHVWYFSDNDIVDNVYFFKGENYYLYNSEDDKVYDGWPRLISEDFGPASDQTEGVPNNLDTAMFDMRDNNIYFFKGEWVYVYDPKETDSPGCCTRKRKIVEEYPPAEGEDPLPADIDNVYYSYKYQTMYFIKNEDVWQNVLFHPRQKEIKNSVKYIGKWYELWFDICDVTEKTDVLESEGAT